MKKKVETEASHGFSRRNLFRAVLGGTMASAVSSRASGVEAATPVDVGDQGMYAVITGSGSAMADPERGNASAAVVVDGTVLQFDFGRKTMDNLMRVGINPINLDYIFFTHLHFDHIATYDYFIISTWIAGRRTPYKVFGPPGTAAMSNGALHHMHEMDVRFVKYIVDTWPATIAEEPPVGEPPVEVTDIEPGLVVETDDFKVTCTATPHLSAPNMYSRGYRVDSKYGSVVISGDTAPSENMVELAKDADILIHECVIPDYGMTTAGKFSRKEFHEKETKNQRTGHTSPTGLGKLAEQAGVKKLVAYHLAPYTSVPAAVEMSEKYTGPNPGPEIWSKFIHAMKNQYSGPVILAEDAMVFEI